MNRKQLANGTCLTVFPVDKFKRCRVSLNFIWQASRATATAEALLPMLMERGNADCPDMTEMSKKLAALYGASLGVETTIIGANRVLTVSVTGIRDKYALSGEKLTQEYAALALATAFKPHLPNGCFDEESVEIEKEQLSELLQSEVNDKRSYCVRQAKRRFFGDAPEGIERSGYLDEVPALTPQAVTDAYKNMISHAQIEVIALGAEDKDIEALLLDALSKIDRQPLPLADVSYRQKQDEQAFKQPVDASQGKLCMLFTPNEIIDADNLSKMRVAIGLLGGTSTSRLFLNVREKQSLCYYCPSSFASPTNMLSIDCGIEHADAQKAKAAILNELDALRTGEITDEELARTKRSLISSFSAVEDSLSSIEFWHFSEIMRGSDKTPADVMHEISQVTAQQAQEMLNKFTLSVTYLLTKEGE